MFKIALQGTLIDENKVECRPEKVSNAILDQSVDIRCVRCFFTHDAWLVVEDMIRRKNEFPVWICKYCQHDLGEEKPSIICESCLEWYHWHCVGLGKQPKAKNWFCRECHRSSSS